MMCEKCWSAAYRDAYCNPSKSQSECYQERVKTCKHPPERDKTDSTDGNSHES